MRENHKSYQQFGVMLDCSRNAVMNVDAIKRFILALQKMGYNALELYMEDTYRVEDEPYFGYLRGGYRGTELREVDAFAKQHGVELIPCIQTLAHFTNMKKLPHYRLERNLFDFDDILMIDDEKTYEFLDRLFAALRKDFSCDKIHIGMDEALMVGLGKYLDRNGYCDRYELLVRHVTRVAEIAKKYGFTPHMWSDMFFRLCTEGEYSDNNAAIPKKVKEGLPEEMELVYWDYYNVEEAHYSGMIQTHKRLKEEVWFAGGAWCWNGFCPDSKFTAASMKPAMRSVVKNGVNKVLITMWGDNGTECSRFSLLQSLYAIRRYADGEEDEVKIAAEFTELFGVCYDDFNLLGLPDEIPDYKVNTVDDLVNPSKVLLYSDPFLGMFDSAAQKASHIPYGDYAQRLGEAKKRAGEYSYLFETEEKLCLVLEAKAYLGIETRKAYQNGDRKVLRALLPQYALAEKRLREFHAAFKARWQKENKPFGFEIHDARLGGLMLRLSQCAERIRDYLAHKIEKIEELEEAILPYSKADLMECNSYRTLISPSEM